MRRTFTALGLAALLGAAVLSPIAAQEGAGETPLINGRFYPQGSDRAGMGFGVTDDSAPMFTQFQRLGGVGAMGYPISRRFDYAGGVTQVFQRGAIAVTAEGARLLPLLDLLSQAGHDGWLAATYGVPARESLADPMSVLAAYPNLRAAYNRIGPDPLAVVGAPTARVFEADTYRTLRTERAVLYESVADGSVSLAHAGELAKEAGLFPASAFQPQTLQQAAAAANVGPAAGGAPPIAPAAPNPPANIQQTLRVNATLVDASPVSGRRSRINVQVLDQGGRPVQGAVILVIVHYPLKNDVEAYTVDGIFFSSQATDAAGNTFVDYTIDPAVPAGVDISIDVSAIYPPTAGKVVVTAKVG